MFKPLTVGRLVTSLAFVVAVPLSLVPANTAQAQSSRNRPPAPSTVAAPTVAGASGETFVQFYTLPLARNIRLQAETVSGPNPVTLNVIGGIVQLSSARPASTYIVRIRANQFYDARTFVVTNLNSAWVTATYTTPARFEIPPAPTNLRVDSSGSGFTTVAWDAPPATSSTPAGTYSYLVSVNGADPIPVCQAGAYNFCPPETYFFASPAPGTSVQLHVLAINLPGNSSVLSAPFLVRG
jgi:hypothetical protein